MSADGGQLRGTPGRLISILDHFLDSLIIDKNSWLALDRFREATLHEIASDDLLDKLAAQFERAERGSEREQFLYRAAFSFTWTASPRARAQFDKLFASAEGKADLEGVRDALMSCTLPEQYLDRRTRHSDGNKDRDAQAPRHEFEKNAEAIRRGEHLNWLIWAADVYLGLFADVDHTTIPKARLEAILGAENAEIALEGLMATLSRPDVPSLEDVVNLAVERQFRTWWLALIAGLTERFARAPELSAIPDGLLRAALAFDLTQPTPTNGGSGSGWVQHAWKTAALRDRPDLLRDAYAAVTRARFGKNDQMIDGLRELLSEDALAPYRAELTVAFLRDFPNANPYPLGELLDTVQAMPATHAAFLALAGRVIEGATTLDERQRDMWLATAFVLSPVRFQTDVEAAARARSGFIFELRNATGFSALHGHPRQTTLLLPQLEFMARLTGSIYPRGDHPSGGWGGDTNPWDASEYFQSLVNTISAMPSQAATGALTRLADDAQLVSYRPWVLHALANQRARRRANEYDRPDWPQTVKALSNGPPATVADFHALLMEHLGDLKRRVASENTDIYTYFWNIDSHARLVDPRPENACRDTLVTLLRPNLAPLGIMVEPEGHMATDKRADISAAMPGRKILCELKRDYHADVWVAAELQLERYTRDPEAQGFGVYGVFWFGDKRGHEIPAPPGGLARPPSAAKMEKMLRERIPAERKNRIAVIVIDVSRPT
jgi:hypothetical protein